MTLLHDDDSTNLNSTNLNSTNLNSTNLNSTNLNSITPQNGYPKCPVIPKDRPWLATYKEIGIKATIDMPADDTSLLEVLEQNFARFEDRDAYICMDTTLSYRKLDNYSRQIAVYLQQIGLKKGDRVAVMMPNILQYPIIMLGIIRAGMVLVNVNPMYSSRELGHQLEDSGTKALFIIENFAKTYQDAVDDSDLTHKIEHVVVCSIGDMLGLIKGLVANAVVRHIKKTVPRYCLPASIKFKDALNVAPAHLYQRPTTLGLNSVALLQYTGGTTGIAKGARLSHGNLIANMLQIDVIVEAAYKDASANSEVILTALPLHHVFSSMVCSIYSTYAGFTGLLIPNPRDLNNLVKQIDKYKPAFIPLVNTLFSGLLHHQRFVQLDFSNLKLAMGGGASVLPNVARHWHQVTGLPIVEGYGLTEASPLASFNPLTIAKFTAKVGVPTVSTDIKLINAKGDEIPIGDRGEICIKGPQIMSGYHNEPEETMAAFTKDGYFKTGDIGIMDDKGFIKIVDRKKDMIIVSGFNVYPNEIESAMIQHPAVLECGSIGVPSKDRGEEPKIFVVKKGDVTEDELLAFGKKQLTGYKRPRQVQFIDAIPKSNVGKILRKDLRKMQGLE